MLAGAVRYPFLSFISVPDMVYLPSHVLIEFSELYISECIQAAVQPPPVSHSGNNQQEDGQNQEMEAATYRSRRVLAEIDPHSEWVHGDEFDTLIVDVSGMHEHSHFLVVYCFSSHSFSISA